MQVALALGCKGETSPCWIQKAKPFAGVGQSPTRDNVNKKINIYTKRRIVKINIIFTIRLFKIKNFIYYLLAIKSFEEVFDGAFYTTVIFH